jgi:CRISPR type III-B/RAMP module RAMP protein Cmr1
MRYWFRALAAGLTSDLERIGEVEDSVFGGTRRGSSSGVQARIRGVPPRSRRSLTLSDEELGVRYLAYGRVDKDGVTEPLVDPGTEFALALQHRDPALLGMAAGSLWLASVFGGLGGRSRRGFGAFAIDDWSGEGASKLRTSVFGADTDEVGDEILRRVRDTAESCVERLGGRADEALDVSHLRVWAVSEGPPLTYLWTGGPRGWRETLDEIGQRLRVWRSGRGKSDPWKDESDAIKDWMNGSETLPTPGRSAFGLPWTMYSRSLGGEARFAPNRGGNDARRASPIQISLAACGEAGKLCGILTPLAGRFLPSDTRLSAKSRDTSGSKGPPHGRSRLDPHTGSVDSSHVRPVIDEFLSDLVAEGLVREVR